MELNDKKIKALPKWAKYKKDVDGINKIFVKPSVVYPIYIKALGLKNDQFGAEVARRCMTEELFEIVGKGMTIHIERDLAWRLSALPAGEGASKGAKSFRIYYNRLKESEHTS